MSKSKIMPLFEDVKHLRIPRHEISLATNGFAKENFIVQGAFGDVYKGVSKKHGLIAVKRLVHREMGQGENEFKKEIALLSNCKHENIVSLLGFCDEDGEMILVYKFESNGSLDKHLNSKDLTWIQRLWICLYAARGLEYLHNDVGPHYRVLHRDIKSSNILLDENWKSKISDFGLARVVPADMKCSFVISNVCGTRGYLDPDYYINGYLTPKTDVYSFGVVLWEVLCGRLAYVRDPYEGVALSKLAQRHYISGTLNNIIPSFLQKQISTASLLTFSKIAYQCLKSVEERPTMKQVVEQLQKALWDQLEVKKPKRKKAEEKTKPADRAERKEKVSRGLLPPPTSQEFVLSVFLHCEGCALKIRRCLKSLEGVEKVLTYCKTHKVVVKGKNADPLKVLERVQSKVKGEVELLSPVPKPLIESKKGEQEEPPKHEEKNEVVPSPVTTVVLEVPMHCEACALEIKKCIRKIKGVERADTDLNNSQVIVKGTFLAAELVDYVHKKTGKKTVIVKQDNNPKTEEANNGKDEHKGDDNGNATTT